MSPERTTPTVSPAARKVVLPVVPRRRSTTGISRAARWAGSLKVAVLPPRREA